MSIFSSLFGKSDFEISIEGQAAVADGVARANKRIAEICNYEDPDKRPERIVKIININDQAIYRVQQRQMHVNYYFYHSIFITLSECTSLKEAKKALKDLRKKRLSKVIVSQEIMYD